MKKISLVVFFSVIFLNSLFAQKITQDIKFDGYSVEDGLPEYFVTSIIQDYLGYMWFGTQDGLARFDGREFKSYVLSTKETEDSRSNVINCIVEDKEKQIWVGTMHGLFVYNRESDTFSGLYPGNDLKVQTNFGFRVKKIIEAEFPYLFLLSEYGELIVFNRENHSFDKIVQDVYLNNRFYGLTDNASYLQNDTVLWFGSTSGGLWRYSIRSKEMKSYFVNTSRNNVSGITCIMEDSSGNIYCGNDQYRELYVLDAQTGKENIYSFAGRDNPGDENAGNCFVFIDSKNRIWITSKGNIMLFNPDDKTFKSIISSIGDYLINFRKEEGENFWMEVIPNYYKFFSMPAYFDVPKSEVFTYSHDQNNPHSFPSTYNSFNSYYKGEDGVRWFGTVPGTAKIDPLTNRFSEAEIKIKNSVSGAIEFPLLVSKDTVWIRSFEEKKIKMYIAGNCEKEFPDHDEFVFIFKNNIFRLGNKLIEKFSKSRLVFEEARLINEKDIKYLRNIQENSFGINEKYCWTAQDTSIIILQYNSKTGLFEFKNSFNFSRIDSIIYESGYLYNDTTNLPHVKGNLFIQIEATEIPAFVLNGVLICFPENRKDPAVFLGEEEGIEGGVEYNNNYYLANYLDGLMIFDPRKGKVVKIMNRRNGGFPENKLFDITILNNDIWITTQWGLYRFDAETEAWIFFSNTDLGIDNANNKYFRNKKSGILQFSCLDKRFVINPEDIRFDTIPPRVTITNLSLFNARILPSGDRSPLDHIIEETKEITLRHNQNVITLEYAALHFIQSERIEYEYKMEGVNEDWQHAGTTRQVNYAGLRSGTYKFLVKARNVDGIWSAEPTMLKITIRPPWWLTSWALGSYLLIFAAAIYLYARFLKRRAHERSETEIRNMETKKIRELSEQKSRFFTNVSHEFRTPLSLITGTIDMLNNPELPEAEKKSILEILQKNSRRLHGLVNNLLELSKLDEGKMKIRLVRENVLEEFRNILSTYDSLARQKEIRFITECSETEMMIYLDREKLEIILHNLLSNAYKHTPAGGQIIFSARMLSVHEMAKAFGSLPKTDYEGNFLKFSISDNGPGIAQEKLDRIFQRFEKDLSAGSYTEGMGIGLALTRELVECQNGLITIESEPGKGSNFTVYLPVDENGFDGAEIVMADAGQQIITTLTDGTVPNTISAGIQNAIPVRKHEKSEDKPVVLIVEDNRDMRDFLSKSLRLQYHIILATDGENGYEKSREQIPDLVITDLMMPKLDGLELCEILKKDEITSHIPVIMLTARANVEDRIAGLQAGADEYLEKPFHTGELLAMIRNLVDQRKKLKEKFGKMILPVVEHQKAESLNEQFINKVLKQIELNMHNIHWSADDYAGAMHLSRSQLHRKIKALTGMGISDFVNTVKLAKAEQMLKNNSGRITEIAFGCGFNDSSYFSALFKKKYGLSPSEYMAKHNKYSRD